MLPHHICKVGDTIRLFHIIVSFCHHQITAIEIECGVEQPSFKDKQAT